LLYTPSGKTIPILPPGFNSDKQRSIKSSSVFIESPFGNSNKEVIGFPLAAFILDCELAYASP
jgi:hypothetical protein